MNTDKEKAMLEAIKSLLKENRRLKERKVIYVEVEPRQMKDWRKDKS